MRWTRSIGLACVLAAAHVGAIALAGAHDTAVSYAFIGLSSLIPAALAMSRSRQAVGPIRHGWAVVALACLTWAVALGMLAYADLSLGNDNDAPAASTLVFILYGVPLTWLVARPDGKFDSRSASAIDAALAGLLGVLCYVHTISLAGPAGPGTHSDLERLTWTFDVENLFLFVGMLLRLSGAQGTAPRNLFLTLAIFTGVYMVAEGYNNHVMALRDGIRVGTWLDLVPVSPFHALTIVTAASATLGARIREPSQAWARIVMSASPVMMVAALLTVSLAVIQDHYVAGALGCVAATVGFALRGALIQSNFHKSEVALIFDRNRLAEQAVSDPLTGVANRRAFDQTLEDEWNRASRSGNQLAVMMIDIDHFKLVNDRYGHAAGDACLRRVAAALVTCLRRPTDVLARYGGEEFAVVMSSTSEEGALAVARTMLEAVAAMGLANEGAARRIVTVSIGVASTTPAAAISATLLLEAADAALYRAKAGGRDRALGAVVQAPTARRQTG